MVYGRYSCSSVCVSFHKNHVALSSFRGNWGRPTLLGQTSFPPAWPRGCRSWVAAASPAWRRWSVPPALGSAWPAAPPSSPPGCRQSTRPRASHTGWRWSEVCPLSWSWVEWGGSLHAKVTRSKNRWTINWNRNGLQKWVSVFTAMKLWARGQGRGRLNPSSF